MLLSRTNLLFARVGELVQPPALERIDVVFGFERTAIHGLGFGLNEHAAAIGRHDVTVYLLDSLTQRVGCVEEHGRLLAGFKRILHHLGVVVADAGILVGARYGGHTTNAAGGILARCDILQRKFGNRCIAYAQQGCQAQINKFFHSANVLVIFPAKIKKIILPDKEKSVIL